MFCDLKSLAYVCGGNFGGVLGAGVSIGGTFCGADFRRGILVVFFECDFGRVRWEKEGRCSAAAVLLRFLTRPGELIVLARMRETQS